MKRVILTVIAFLVLHSTSYSSFLIDRIVAVVGRDVITWSELYKSMEFEFSDKLQGLSPEKRREFLKQYEKEYLERLIDMKVQLKEAERLNISVSKEEVDRAIEQIRNKYGLSPEQFEEAIRAQGLSIDEYRDKLSEQILLNKIQSYKISPEVFVSDKEIDEYIMKNQDKFNIERGYRFRQILLRVKDEQEKALAEEVSKKVMERLREGVPFDRATEGFIKAPDVFTGKESLFVSDKDLAGQLKDVLDSMREGQYSDPFWTERGLVILYLEERVDLKDSVRDIARERLKQARFQRKLKDWIRALRSKYFIEIKL